MIAFDFFKRILKEQPVRFSIIISTSVLSGLLEGLGISLFIPLLNLVIGKNQSVGVDNKIAHLLESALAIIGVKLSIGSILLSIFLLISLQQAVILIQQYVFLNSLYWFERNVREGLYTKILNAGWPFFLTNRVGSLTNVLTNESTRAGQAYIFLNLIISSIILIGIYIILALSISWIMTAVAFSIGLFAMILLRKRINRSNIYGSAISEVNEILQNESTEQISGAKLVKGCSVEESSINRFNNYLEILFKNRFKQDFNASFSKSLFEFSMAGILCGGIYLSVKLLKIDMASLVIFLFIFYRLAPRISNFQNYLHSLLANLPALNVIEDIKASADQMIEKSGSTLVEKTFDKIRFEKVSFSYDGKKEILKSLNFNIPRGKAVAIVGGSGAGKSTIIDLIMGLLTPDSGYVLLDETPLSNFNIKSWRNKIGYVAQDTVLFNDTVNANIKWAFPAATDNEIKEAAKLSYANEFIMGLPDGYNALVGDRGIRLSGGQRQRIALARAIIRKPDLLILDEATSALDAESEQKIQQAVERLSESITIVLVTHRLATVKIADYIYVLENGELIEKGSWDELISLKGRFLKLKQLQELGLNDHGKTKHSEESVG